MAKAIHSMIRVADKERSLEFYGKAFGLNVADSFDFDRFMLIYLSNKETEFELELTVNKGQGKPYDLGDGYGHIAFSVADISHEEFADILKVRCWLEERALRESIANGDAAWEEALVLAAFRLSKSNPRLD